MAPQLFETARDRQGRIRAEVTLEHLAVVSHDLDYPLPPAIVQAHCNSDWSSSLRPARAHHSVGRFPRLKPRPESSLAQPAFSPSRTMFFYPIQEGAFKTDVAADLFAFNVLMPQDLVAFGQELPIKT